MGVVSVVPWPNVNFLQEVEKLKKTNAESNQVKILNLRKQVAFSKMVKERSMSW